MTRFRVLLAGAAPVLAATLAACAGPDRATAPEYTTPGGPALRRGADSPALYHRGGDGGGRDRKDGVVTYKIGDTTVTEFTVDPTKKDAYGIAGEHKIAFPANSICDPARSSYGPGTWDEPCELLTSRIHITARSYRNAEGLPRVDFSPALRFRVSPAGPVRLYLLNKRADASLLTIYYCPDNARCVDEALADPSLATHYDETTGFNWRSIKHFSGYTVSIGRDATYATAY